MVSNCCKSCLFNFVVYKRQLYLKGLVKLKYLSYMINQICKKMVFVIFLGAIHDGKKKNIRGWLNFHIKNMNIKYKKKFKLFYFQLFLKFKQLLGCNQVCFKMLHPNKIFLYLEKYIIKKSKIFF